MKDAATIAGELRTEAQRLREQAKHCSAVADLLDPPYSGPVRPRQDLPVQHRKSHVRSPESIAKQRATLARKRAQAAPQAPQTTTLRVLSSTHPTKEELADRELVHTTEEPHTTKETA